MMPPLTMSRMMSVERNVYTADIQDGYYGFNVAEWRMRDGTHGIMSLGEGSSRLARHTSGVGTLRYQMVVRAGGQ
jgi:hypothetical protein